MGQPRLMVEISKKILPRVTSLGLNEQELVFLAKVAGGLCVIDNIVAAD